MLQGFCIVTSSPQKQIGLADCEILSIYCYMVYAQCDIFFQSLTNFVLVTGLSWNKLDKNHQNASTERTVVRLKQRTLNMISLCTISTRIMLTCAVILVRKSERASTSGRSACRCLCAKKNNFESNRRWKGAPKAENFYLDAA